MKINFLKPGCMVLITLFAFSCTEKATEPEPTIDNTEFMEILTEAGKLEKRGEDSDVITDTSSIVEGNFRVTYEKHDVVNNIESIAFLGLNDDIIWPGSLIRGKDAHNFVYYPIVVDREPITMSVSWEGAVTGDLVQTVENPTRSSTRQGISDLIEKATVEGTKAPASVEFFYQQVYSESHMDLFVGADVSYSSFDLSSQFDWTTQTKKTRVMAKYMQIYYTIDIDTPKKPADFFSPSNTMDELRTAMPPGSMPLYVAGVSYGMMALMFIESDYSYEKLDWALNVSLDVGTVEIDAELGLTNVDIMQNSSIKIIVYGGSTAGLNELETGYNGFNNVIDASSDYGPDSPAVPLVYKFRHLIDNTLALVTLTSQYTLVKPLRIRQPLRLTICRFICYEETLESGDIEMIQFRIWANAFNRADANDPGVQINRVDEVLCWWDGYASMTTNDILIIDGQFLDFVFDTENYDFNLAEIKLSAYCLEEDYGLNPNDPGRGNTTISGQDFFGPDLSTIGNYPADDENHYFHIHADDDGYRFYACLKIEPLD